MSEMKDNFHEYYHTVYGFLMSLTEGDHDLAEELTQMEQQGRYRELYDIQSHYYQEEVTGSEA